MHLIFVGNQNALMSLGLPSSDPGAPSSDDLLTSETILPSIGEEPSFASLLNSSEIDLFPEFQPLSSQQTEVDSALTNDFFFYETKAKAKVALHKKSSVVICVDCGMAFETFNRLKGHFTHTHKKDSLSAEDEVKFYDDYRESGCYEIDLETYIRGLVVTGPIPLVKVHRGLECLECGRLSISDKKLKEHFKDAHPTISSVDRKSKTEKDVSFQIVYFGNQQREYCRVKLPDEYQEQSTAVDQDLLDEMLSFNESS